MNDDEPIEPADAAEPATLRLDHFLRIHCIVDSGGQAKVLIQGGEVQVNGQIETRRRRKLVAGDVVEVGGEKRVVASQPPAD